jgi:hypothetical protein
VTPFAPGSVRLAGACWDVVPVGVSAEAADAVTAMDATSATTPTRADPHRQAEWFARAIRRCLGICLSPPLR